MSELHADVSRAPVFVVGCPRSGTTLLYHMLLSSGGFALYRAETHVFNSLAPRFGGFRRGQDISEGLEVWLKSDCHTLTGLPSDAVRAEVLAGARDAGSFLRIIMDMMVKQQAAQRWAETTPAHVLHMREIQAQIPEARFIHVIRDGRDVATSLERQGWIRPLPWDRERPVVAAAAYWDWIVRRGRREGAALGDAYHEIRYEALVEDAATALQSLEAFIGHRLDLGVIERAGIGSVGRPNSSFPETKGGFQSRWRTHLTPELATEVGAMLAPTLSALRYKDVEQSTTRGPALRREAYFAQFAARHALKQFPAFGRRATDLSHFRAGSMVINEEKLFGLHGATRDSDPGAITAAERD